MGKALGFLRDLKGELQRDELGDVAAMLTYYAILSLFPMILFVLTLGLLVVPDSFIQQGIDMLTRAIPSQAGAIVERYVGELRAAAAGGLAVGGALLALWTASRGTVSLSRALNKVYGVEEQRPWWKIQLTGILATVGAAVALLVLLALLAFGPWAGGFVAERLNLDDAFATAWAIGRWLLATVTVTALWSFLYRSLPDRRTRLRVFSPGALAGVLIWLGASLLFALYVRNFGKYEATYGALGAVIIFLVWLWISNLALLVGAAVNHILERREARQPNRVTSGEIVTQARPHPRET